jgi:uncharacterized protein YlxW (UPF0749 family)
MHPTRRTVTHHRRLGDRIETRVVSGGAIEMDPPGIVITVDDIYRA